MAKMAPGLAGAALLVESGVVPERLAYCLIHEISQVRNLCSGNREEG
jgi:hypothetical protein